MIKKIKNTAINQYSTMGFDGKMAALEGLLSTMSKIEALTAVGLSLDTLGNDLDQDELDKHESLVFILKAIADQIEELVIAMNDENSEKVDLIKKAMENLKEPSCLPLIGSSEPSVESLKKT